MIIADAFAVRGSGENKGFTDRCIAKAQRASIRDGLFIQTLTEYLINKGRIAYDNKRDLFWVLPTSGPPQVAVWMMPLVTDQEAA